MSLGSCFYGRRMCLIFMLKREAVVAGVTWMPGPVFCRCGVYRGGELLGRGVFAPGGI